MFVVIVPSLGSGLSCSRTDVPGLVSSSTSPVLRSPYLVSSPRAVSANVAMPAPSVQSPSSNVPDAISV